RFVGLKEGSCANALSNTSRHRWPERFEAIVGALSRELSEGAELPTWVVVRAEDRLNVEGKSHGVLKAGVATLVHEHERLRADEIRELVLSSAVARDAKVRAIRYQVSLRQCARCAIMARPEVRVCPACGSREWRMPHGQKLLFGIEDEAMPEGN
ncbi:MAG: hypothetical protein KDB07_12600, partial [Planctomycetes bacterium]|nr:hypothetical protein [Planctomycetota bacterium]